MSAQHFSGVSAWVFDLDDTLYPPSARLFEQVARRMTTFITETLDVAPEAAASLRERYRAEYGTTLAGLMEVHGIAPEPYLAWVHDIDFAALTPDPQLRARIAALPGRRIVYTNGCAPYAERVLAGRGLTGLFDAIYGVEHAGYRPKPQPAAFDTVFAADGLDPARAAMFEDDARNLVAPHAMGMRTVHVAPSPQPAAHIHHHTDDLSGFLARLGA